jgi:hypothetical protein
MKWVCVYPEIFAITEWLCSEKYCFSYQVDFCIFNSIFFKLCLRCRTTIVYYDKSLLLSTDALSNSESNELLLTRIFFYINIDDHSATVRGWTSLRKWKRFIKLDNNVYIRSDQFSSNFAPKFSFLLTPHRMY